MPNYLDIPPELNHLIEKRDESQRRQADRRSEEPQATVEGSDRRDNSERRQEQRRAEDD